MDGYLTSGMAYFGFWGVAIVTMTPILIAGYFMNRKEEKSGRVPQKGQLENSVQNSATSSK